MSGFLRLRIVRFGDVLVVFLLVLLEGAPFPQASGSSSSHSLQYFCTSVSEPGEGLPQFIAVGYLDNQLICRYDNNSWRPSAQAPWMEKADAHYWNTETEIMQSKENEVREHLRTIMNYYSQPKGFHTLQLMYGCELRRDGSKGGYYQYAYDGRKIISLDKETLTWEAADVQAQTLKRRWDANPLIADSIKAYLEETCIKWLKKNLDYGKETLLRIEIPVGKVRRQAIAGGQESLICQAYGFYPREIEATWRKGEEILEHETFRRNIAPNSDGTYHIWLSIKIDPKERDLYRCHVDHASLPKPLVLVFKEPDDNKGHPITESVLLITITGSMLMTIMLLFILLDWLRRRRVRRARPTMKHRGFELPSFQSCNPQSQHLNHTYKCAYAGKWHTKAEEHPKKCQNLGDSKITSLHPMDDDDPS